MSDTESGLTVDECRAAMDAARDAIAREGKGTDLFPLAYRAAKDAIRRAKALKPEPDGGDDV